MEELTKLGLTENQSKVYEELIKNGPCRAGVIIKKTDLHREIVYDCLEKLIKKGLVNYILTKNVKQYSVSAPKELEEYISKQKSELKEKEEVLKEIIKKLKNKEKENPSIARIYQGKKGLRTVFEELFNPKYEILIFATGWGMKSVMKDYFYQWHLKLRKNKVKGRAILNRGIKLEDEYPYKIRYLSKEYISPSATIIYDKKIINIVWQEDPIVIVIESEKISESYKKYFEMLWKIAK
jgi:sugar-specific transcriptional regulator TrmB